MKIFKNVIIGLLSMMVMGITTSCDSSDDPATPPIVVDFNNITDFNAQNYWSKCYDVQVGDFNVDNAVFSHTASAFEWDGVVYSSWKGFCPSRVNDPTDHKDDWVNNQWACISANPYNGIYLVGNSESVVSENPLENRTCTFRLATWAEFVPKYVFVNNSSYTYFCAKNGSAFNPAFTAEDKLTLTVVGVRGGAMTSKITVPLISGGAYLTQWTGLSLESLGTVDEILFYVDSTQKNEYGLTVPAYFCVTEFAYSMPEVQSLN